MNLTPENYRVFSTIEPGTIKILKLNDKRLVIILVITVNE